MKKYALLLAVLFSLIWIIPSFAMAPVTCFDHNFVRGKGKPLTESYTFPGIAGPATIQLTNNKISSATVSVNGEVVFGPSDFNQNVESLEATVTLNEGNTNTIDVTLKSKPGSTVHILIEQLVEAEAGGFVGPEGVVFSVDNSESPLHGVGIEAAQDACEIGTLMTISVEAQPPATPLPEGVVPDGPCISFESSDNDFQEPVYIMLPFTGERQEDELRLVYTYDELKGKWELVTPLPTEDPSIFVAMVEHFSHYIKGRASITATSISTSFEIGRDSLQFNQNNLANADCPYDDPNRPGICGGMAILSAKYFNHYAETENESLMCRWDIESSFYASCGTFHIYKERIGATIGDFWDAFKERFLRGRDQSYIIDYIKDNARNNLVTPVFMWPNVGLGHSVVALGWNSAGSNSGGIKIYDVNNNEAIQTILYYPEYDPDLGETFIRMNYLVYDEFRLDPLTRNLDISPVIDSFPKTDLDNDGIGNGLGDGSPCDNCPDTPNPDQSDSDGDQVGNACDQCPGTQDGEEVDKNGCSVYQLVNIMVQYAYPPNEYGLALGIMRENITAAEFLPHPNIINTFPGHAQLASSPIDDAYPIRIYYNDGTIKDFKYIITDINENYAQITKPADGEVVDSSDFTIEWQTPAGTVERYLIIIVEITDTGQEDLWSSELAPGTNSCIYNFDGGAVADLKLESRYLIHLHSYDDNENQATYLSEFIYGEPQPATYSEDFEDDSIEWFYPYGDHEFKTGPGGSRVLHMLSAPGGPGYNTEVGLAGSDFIYHFAADIYISSSVDQMAWMNLDLREADLGGYILGIAAAIYFDPAVGQFQVSVQKDGAALEEEYLGTFNLNTWHSLSITIHDDYVTFGIDGELKNISCGLFNAPESIIESVSWIQVNATNELGAVDYYVDNMLARTSPLSMPAVPPSPTGLTADYVEANNWNWITWNNVAEAVSYNLYWGTESGVTQCSEFAGNTPTTEFSHTGVVPGSTYYYKVTAVDANGIESALSGEVSASVSSEDFPVNFPDPNLEAEIRKEIFKPSGIIMYSDLQAMKYFSASHYSGIVNLEGLQYCTNINWITLGFDQISDLSPLSGLVNLSSLGIYYTQISDLSPLSGLVNLSSLDLGSNNITDISPLSGLVNLSSLRIDYNQITDISPLSGLVNLSYLNLYSNKISDYSPLVNNLGIGSGDYVDVRVNLLNSTACNIHFPELINRGVSLMYSRKCDMY